jgi:hypothetical protein
MNTSSIASSAPKARLATSAELKKAAQIRKDAAAKLGVRPSFIRMKECVKRAMGQRVMLKSCFGSMLNCPGWMIDLFLCSEDSTIIINSDAIMKATGISERHIVQAHLAFLADTGVIGENHGFCSVLNSKRPYTNVVGEGHDFFAWKASRESKVVEA